MAKEILLTNEAAEYLRVSPSTLESMRSLKRGPTYFRVGKQVRYRLDDLDAYINSTREGGQS